MDKDLISTYCKNFHEEKVERKKEKILKDLFDSYKKLVANVSYKYNNMYPGQEVADWVLLCQTAIWEEVRDMKDFSTASSKIYWAIIKAVTKEEQKCKAIGRAKFKEVCQEYVDFGVNPEQDWVTKIDVEAAIEKLPELLSLIIRYTMEGMPVLSVKYPSSISVNPASSYRSSRAPMATLIFCIINHTGS
jgi:hypothetical protein